MPIAGQGATGASPRARHKRKAPKLQAGADGSDARDVVASDAETSEQRVVIGALPVVLASGVVNLNGLLDHVPRTVASLSRINNPLIQRRRRYS